MLIFRLCNLIRGYVVVKLNNPNYEKTLNLLRRKNIKLWDIEKTDIGIKFKISYEDYKNNLNILNSPEMEPLKKTGFAFKYKKLKVRKGFMAGLFLLVLCLVIFANLVWNIEVIGADYTLSKNIIRTLKENNITVPSTSAGLNHKLIETILHKSFENLKFIEAYTEGSKLIIFVKEKEVNVPILKENMPSSIVATKNAIISKIITKNGQTVVRVGDVVYEGQTLVMGIVKNKNSDEFMMVPSEGTIYGKTYYSFEYKEEKVKNITVSTNNEKKIYYFKINDNNIKIIGDIKPFENYNYSEREIRLPLISRLTNTSLIKGTYYEEKTKEIQIDEATAQNRMKINMYDELIKLCNKDSKILNTSFDLLEDNKYYYLKAQVEVIEDIGKSVKIYPNEENKTDEVKED